MFKGRGGTVRGKEMERIQFTHVFTLSFREIYVTIKIEIFSLLLVNFFSLSPLDGTEGGNMKALYFFFL